MSIKSTEGKKMAKGFDKSNLEIHDLQFFTEEELRDVVAVFTTKQSALSQREADILDEAEIAYASRRSRSARLIGMMSRQT